MMEPWRVRPTVGGAGVGIDNRDGIVGGAAGRWVEEDGGAEVVCPGGLSEQQVVFRSTVTL